MNAAVGTAIRYVSLLVFTGITLFILPEIIRLQHFLAALNRVGATLVMLGFLPYAGLTIKTGPLDLSLWNANMYWYPALAPITSVFVNPNALGFLTLIGAIAAFVELQTHRTKISILLLGINSLGLLFTNYRTGWIAFLAATGVFVVYSIGGKRLLMLYTVCGLSVLSLLLMMIFSIIPGPAALTEVSLNNRRPRWVISIFILQDQFWWGSGLGNVREAIQPYTAEETGSVHNSYLRMFVAFGFGGGLVYLLFYLSVVFDSVRQSTEYRMVVIPALLIAFLFVQMFNDLTFIGVSMHSIVIALSMGYCISSVADDKSTCNYIT